jgi:hypothetical protein
MAASFLYSLMLFGSLLSGGILLIQFELFIYVFLIEVDYDYARINIYTCHKRSFK